MALGGLGFLPSYKVLSPLCGAWLALCFLLADASGARARPAKYGALGLQIYPAGAIVALRSERAVGATGLAALWLGFNRTDRRDWGEHDDEHGGGVGVGLGGRRYWRPGLRGWHMGGAVEFWRLQIDWRHGGRRGQSRVAVLQPTGHFCYTWGGGVWALEAVVALGGEINVRTRGEGVGQGAILLGGLRLRRPW